MVTKNIFRSVVDYCKTPTFVYHEKRLRKNIERITSAANYAGLEDRINLQASYFSNAHPRIYRIIASQGIGIVVQSIEEVHQLAWMGTKAKISAALSSAPDDELDFFIDEGATINVFIPEELKYCLNKSDDVFVRLDASPKQDQRIGLKFKEFRNANELFNKMAKHPSGIHTYPGTGSDINKLLNHANDVFKIYNTHFNYVKRINLGGGFAFDYSADADKKHFPWDRYFQSLADKISANKIPEDVTIEIEPGRELFADIGELIVSINRVHKRKDEPIQQVFTDGSYVLLPSASTKGRQHEVEYLDPEFSSIIEKEGYCTLNGCTTLSSDYVFPGTVRSPTYISAGEYIIIKDVGAYGASQHLEFLNKRPAAEVFITEDGKIELITERGKYTDRTRNMCWKTLEYE